MIDIIRSRTFLLRMCPALALSLAAASTGMGEDGADGMATIRAGGGVTIAESESSCVVYGMPRAAVRRGGASLVLPL